MRVALAVLGRFHAFDYGRVLAGQGRLARLFTSWPRGRVAAFGVPAERITSLPALEALNRAAHRLPSFLGDHRSLAAERFGRAVAGRLEREPELEVVHGWSGSSLETLTRARELGILGVVERASTHILHQAEVLAAEYGRLGLPGRAAHPRIVERELLEYQSADLVVVPSGYARRTFLERGLAPERVACLPYGVVGLERFRPPDEDRTGPFTLMHCGTVSVRKGCHLLLEAWRRLRLPRARLWLVGPVAPEMRPFLARAPEGVRVFGRVPQPSAAELMRQASALALASLEEGLAFVVPQAMASGLAVVASEASGAGDLIEHGQHGLLVPPGDVHALEEAVGDLYRSPERRRALGAAGRERVARIASWEHYAERARAAYAALRSRPAEAA